MDASYNDRKAAYHEAGHAVVALQNGFPVSSVSIDAAGGGKTQLAWWHQFIVRYSGRKNTLLYIEYLLAGNASEVLVRREEDTHHGGVHDLARARYMAMCNLISEKDLAELRARVLSFVQEHQNVIVVVAERLLVAQHISGCELRRLIGDALPVRHRP